MISIADSLTDYIDLQTWKQLSVKKIIIKSISSSFPRIQEVKYFEICYSTYWVQYFQ